MANKTEAQQNQDAIEFAENYNKKVAPSLKAKTLVFLSTAAFAAAGFLGIGSDNKEGKSSEEMTQQNNEEIIDAAQKGGEDVHEIEIPQKGGDGAPIKGGPEVDLIDATQMDLDENGNHVWVDPATGQELPYVPGNDGAASVATEREANESADK